MRLAYVCNDPGIPVFGSKGASVHVRELVRAYQRLGHKVTLVAARLGGPVPASLEQLEVIDVGRAQVTDTSRRELVTIEIDRRIQLLLADRCDIDLVHERYSLWGGGAVHAAASSERASVLEVNAPLIEEQATHRELVHDRLARERLSAMVSAATVVTAVSAPAAAWVRAQTGRLDGIHVVPNGVDVERIRPGDGRAARAFTVGFVGTLKPWHGVEVLIDAMVLLRGQIPDARLLVVGDGPLAPTVLGAAARHRIPIEHTGALSPEEVPGQLTRMDVGCAPYPAGDEAAYFSPLKVFEYLAAGVPVVASATGQLPDLLAHGRCGVLVAPGDAAALASALRELALQPARREGLALAGRRQAELHHTWHQVACRTLQLARDHERTRLGATPCR